MDPIESKDQLKKKLKFDDSLGAHVSNRSSTCHIYHEHSLDTKYIGRYLVWYRIFSPTKV